MCKIPIFSIFTSLLLNIQATNIGQVKAKNALVEREHEFIKHQPLSKDLKQFIARYQRYKRSDPQKLYMVQDNHLVPVKNLKELEQSEVSAPGGPYTVVPLVVPIKPKRTVVEATTPPDESSVLHKILENVESLMHVKGSSPLKNGLICNLNGSWVSDAAGMRFDICYKNSTKFRIRLADRVPADPDGFLCDSANWTLFGDVPFPRSGLVIVLAVRPRDKHLATFIGECRVCDGSETVTGTWLLGRSARDCKDEKSSHKVLMDVWRRETAHLLRKKHLEQLGYNDNSNK